MRITILHILIVLAVFVGCKRPSKSESIDESRILHSFTPKYAKGFSISTFSSGFFIDVFNPWQGARGINYRYFFVDPDSIRRIFDATEIIPFPVSRIVCLSTTHIAFIDFLNESHRIVGVSGANFVSSHNVRERIEQGLVKDVGYEQTINYELLLSLKPDVVFTYGVGAEAAGYLPKLKDLKIPVVFIGDYLEDSPLGKAEWIKVFGILLGKHDLAQDIFSEMERHYITTKDLVDEAIIKPKVFVNLPWNDAWYFPGNDGYMAKLIEDAGGKYLLHELTGNQSYPFSIESALVKGMDATIWINTGSANSLNQIMESFPRLEVLPAFRTGMVFNNNKRSSLGVGNDFWESGVVNPHIILMDLVKIFYPDSIHHEMVYYQKLE